MDNLFPVIWWIRRDLRIADNPALTAAIQYNGPVIPLFIRDPALEASPFVGARRLAFLHRSLIDLGQQLKQHGGKLLIRSGVPEAVLSELCQQLQVKAICAEADYSPFAQRRDQAIARTLPLRLLDGVAIRPVGQILKKDGTPYTVFTPFSKSWKRQPLPTKKQLLPAPQQLNSPDLVSEQLPTDTYKFDLFPPSITVAQERLQQFASASIFKYGQQRDMVAENGTASLSPYLRFGLISAREAAVAALQAMASAQAEQQHESAETWLNELLWRDFYINILYHFPRSRLSSFRPVYERINWQNDPDDFKAWCDGLTGYPIVDAAMRQLNQSGWMHNRARMITASFLVKDLLVNWQWGERYFMQQLLDGDPAANNGGWQWTAGTGTDAAPYFRIFNPITQGKKFDPAGHYIRRWLPELANLPDKLLHEPWLMTPLDQLSHGCKIGQDYPLPLIDHKFARNRTLDAYKQARAAE